MLLNRWYGDSLNIVPFTESIFLIHKRTSIIAEYLMGDRVIIWASAIRNNGIIITVLQKRKKIRTAFRKWMNVTYEAIKKKTIKTDHLQELHCCLNCYHTCQGWLLFFVHCIMEDSTLGPVYTRQELTPRIMLPAVGWLFWIVFINTRTNGHFLSTTSNKWQIEGSEKVKSVCFSFKIYYWFQIAVKILPRS